jgi:hypothetical protein
MPNQLSLTHIHTSNPTPTLPYLSVHCSSRSIPAEPPTPPPPYLPTYLPTPHSLSFSSVPLLLSRDVLWQWSMYKPFVVLEHRPDGHHHHHLSTMANIVDPLRSLHPLPHHHQHQSCNAPAVSHHLLLGNACRSATSVCITPPSRYTC